MSWDPLVLSEMATLAAQTRARGWDRKPPRKTSSKASCIFCVGVAKSFCSFSRPPTSCFLGVISCYLHARDPVNAFVVLLCHTALQTACFGLVSLRCALGVEVQAVGWRSPALRQTGQSLLHFNEPEQRFTANTAGKGGSQEEVIKQA